MYFYLLFWRYRMNSELLNIEHSRGAEEIKAFCDVLSQELGLQRLDSWWSRDLNPSRDDAPHCFTVTTTIGARQYWFTAEEVSGYLGGQTTDWVQSIIRAELEDLLY
jgi:hypothetical protein